jgi:glutamate racemase
MDHQDVMTGCAPGTPPLHVGLFDSGVGGLSVLRALYQALARAQFSYFADSSHAPYGERDPAHVIERSMRITAALVERGAGAIVVACNTATALAVDALRTAYPLVPIIGVEPGIKPAAARSRVGRIGVLATPATLASERFERLVREHAGGVEVVCQPCPGLAARIEAGDLDAPDLVQRVAELCKPLRERGVDVVVLGCTHYPFVHQHVQAALGTGVEIIDTAQAVAQQAARRCEALMPTNANPPGSAALLTHARDGVLARLAAQWLPFECREVPAPAELA